MSITQKVDISGGDVAGQVMALQKWAVTVGAGVTTTVAVAAGAANVMTITIQVTDEGGAAIAGAQLLTVFMSAATSGVGLTSTAYSGDLVASTGSIFVEPVSKKMWTVQTDATGKFVGGLTATGKPATEYVVVLDPDHIGQKVSVASGTNWG